ncbi:hypothetical protein Tco_0795821 [Tanacetum coccineum]
MENPDQAFVNYASSCNNEVGDKQFTTNQGPINFNEATDTWKDMPNFSWARAQTFISPQTSLFSTYSSSYQTKLEKTLSDFDSRQERRLSSIRTQLEQQQDDMISKINNLWKDISGKLDDTPTPDTTGKSIAHMNLASTNRIKKKSSEAKELNKNPLFPKRVHFINSVVILSKESEAKGEGSVKPSEAECNDHKRTVEEKEEFREESEKELEEETEEETKKEEEDDPEYFDTFPTMKELGYHEWLLKNP